MARTVLHLGSVAILILATGLAACSGHREPPPDRQEHPLFFSPNGEPLSGGPLGHPRCPDAMASWLKRVGTSREGALTEAELVADAKAQFARMDLDHDGFITPAELSVYRQPYEDTPPPPSSSSRQPQPLRTHLRDTADPVMSADRGLNFRVNETDLMAQAHDLFLSLDKGRKGYLTADDLSVLCRRQESRKP